MTTLNKSHVQYVLARFDNGVPPYRILIGLQYRDFLPSISVATIERCLLDNGRVLKYQQVGNIGPSTATQGHGQYPTSAAMGDSATADDHVADPGSTTMQWDARADTLALAAYRNRKSGDEIWNMLRSQGYDITRAEVVINLIRQGVQVAR